MGNVVDHVCAQLADAKLLTCHSGERVDKDLDSEWNRVDALYIFP